MMRWRKIFLGVMLAGTLFFVFFFWFLSSGNMLLSGSAPERAIALGRLFGLLLAYSALLQLVLIGRVPWVEQVFGLDRLSRAHQWNGYALTFFLIAHPMLLVSGYADAAGISMLSQFRTFLWGWEDVLQAFLASLLFGTIIVLSVSFARKRLRYELWYGIHLFTYFAIALSFGHQLKSGDLFQSPTADSLNPFLIYWLLLYAFVGIHIALFRFGRPLWYLWRHRFVVERVERETPSTVSVYITGRNMGRFPVRPGQFMILRFLQRSFWLESHPFSLSMVPDGTRIRITVKNSGDYTARIGDLRPGTPVVIDGPNGVFTFDHALRDKALFIAGGIGITPIRSLMEEMARAKRDVVLLYANKISSDIPLRNELDGLASAHGIRIVYVVSDDPGWQGERGRIDVDLVKRLVPDVRERDIYVCGPPLMMRALIGALRADGIQRHLIHFEKFSLGG